MDMFCQGNAESALRGRYFFTSSLTYTGYQVYSAGYNEL